MACCAFGPCGRERELEPGPGLVLDEASGTWRCYLCYVQPILPKPRQELEDVRDLAAPAEEVPPPDCRDGEYDYLEGKRHNPTFERRSRAGPLYVPSDRRV